MTKNTNGEKYQGKCQEDKTSYERNNWKISYFIITSTSVPCYWHFIFVSDKTV